MSKGQDDINELIRQSLQRRSGEVSSNYTKLQHEKKFKAEKDYKYVNKVGSSSSKIFNKVIKDRKETKLLIRPNYKDFKFSYLKCKKTKLDLQHGFFNGCIIKNNLKEDEYICAYRENEDNIYLCRLDSKFDIIIFSLFDLKLHHSADPRLIWTKNNQLLMVYSYYEEKMETEHIVGLIVMENDNKFVKNIPFRISPAMLNTRQKNWVPFEHQGDIYFVGEIKPHTIYKLNNFCDNQTELMYSLDWKPKWFSHAHMRGNTPPVLLDDDTFLGTFHTVETIGGVHFYDNGFYTFKANPPFNAIKSASRTFLPAEAACEAYFRKHEHIVCPFPIGIVRDKDDIHISYGDNDSSVKIISTTINEVLFNLELK
jgi:predicted GH43/DUF377 family glycosyl hydrolase